jgi:cytochrome c
LVAAKVTPWLVTAPIVYQVGSNFARARAVMGPRCGGRFDTFMVRVDQTRQQLEQTSTRVSEASLDAMVDAVDFVSDTVVTASGRAWRRLQRLIKSKAAHLLGTGLARTQEAGYQRVHDHPVNMRARRRSMWRGALVLLLVVTSSAVWADAVEDGAEVFRKCRACHQVGESARNLVGPHLNGLFGRKAGTVDGFTYSDANKSSGVVWDERTFAEYIKDPKAAMPGNRKVFAGIKDEDDIKNLIAYLRTFGADGRQAK